MTFSIKTFFYWMIAAIALITLADPFPKFAMSLVWILIFGTVLTHWQDYLSYINPPVSSPTNNTGGGGHLNLQ